MVERLDIGAGKRLVLEAAPAAALTLAELVEERPLRVHVHVEHTVSPRGELGRRLARFELTGDEAMALAELLVEKAAEVDPQVAKILRVACAG